MLTSVLHVPLLQNNLLSVLFLTKHRGFNVWIDHDAMHFIRKEETLFVAKVDDTKPAYLAGSTVDQTTLPSKLISKLITCSGIGGLEAASALVVHEEGNSVMAAVSGSPLFGKPES